MDWAEAVWHVYESPKGVRVESPRRVWPPRGTDAHKKGYCTYRPLRDHEMRKDEKLVATVHGVSRQTVVDLIKRNGVGQINESIAALNSQPPSAILAAST